MEYIRGMLREEVRSCNDKQKQLRVVISKSSPAHSGRVFFFARVFYVRFQNQLDQHNTSRRQKIKMPDTKKYILYHYDPSFLAAVIFVVLFFSHHVPTHLPA